MTEDVQQRTRKEKYEREIPVEVRPVLGDKEESDDDEEAEEGDVEAAHRKERGKLFVMIVVLFAMRRMIAAMSSHEHHERTEKDEEPRQHTDETRPLEGIRSDQEGNQTNKCAVEPEGGNGRFHTRVWEWCGNK
jgi:hypothetical protein